MAVTVTRASCVLPKPKPHERGCRNNTIPGLILAATEYDPLTQYILIAIMKGLATPSGRRLSIRWGSIQRTAIVSHVSSKGSRFCDESDMGLAMSYRSSRTRCRQFQKPHTDDLGLGPGQNLTPTRGIYTSCHWSGYARDTQPSLFLGSHFPYNDQNPFRDRLLAKRR
jgi:hypothetical protein